MRNLSALHAGDNVIPHRVATPHSLACYAAVLFSLTPASFAPVGQSGMVGAYASKAGRAGRILPAIFGRRRRRRHRQRDEHAGLEASAMFQQHITEKYNPRVCHAVARPDFLPKRRRLYCESTGEWE